MPVECNRSSYLVKGPRCDAQDVHHAEWYASFIIIYFGEKEAVLIDTDSIVETFGR
jgi:hypothetical protein